MWICILPYVTMSIQLFCFFCVDAHTHDHSNHVGKSLKNNKNVILAKSFISVDARCLKFIYTSTGDIISIRFQIY
jgi:hypothetical protein